MTNLLKRIGFILLFFCVIINSLMAQKSEIKLNVDSLYQQARQQAFRKEYDKALDLTGRLLAVYPDNRDVRLLHASILAWKKDYTKALGETQYLLAQDSDALDVYLLRARIFWWQGKNKQALSAVDEGLNRQKTDEELLKLKMTISRRLGNVEEADRIAKQLGIEPPEVKSVSLIGSYDNVDYRNLISLEYVFEAFNEPYRRRWHILAAGYGRKTHYGDFWAKVYAGDLVSNGEQFFSEGTALQYSLELYPRMDSKNYMYLNAAFSGAVNFPKIHAGAEFYHTFKEGVEASLGYRYFCFEPGADKVKVNLFTGSLSLYRGKYWLSFRPFWIQEAGNHSLRYALSVRNYPTGNENYLEIVASTGTQPDNPAFYTNGEKIDRLSNWRIGFNGKSRLLSWLFVSGGISTEWSEYRSGEWRNQVGITASLNYVF